ncbi:MAG: RidA family protein [Verrucomicrobia subdivision 3 bacterium]|nr:RidA family protein [Limisphaerales bacterium]
MGAEHRIEVLNLDLPPAPKPGGVYQPVFISDNFAYVSGHGPLLNDESYITGKVGAELNTEAAKVAARQTGLAILASLRVKLGSLDRVAQLVKSFGMVNATSDFLEHPLVINGYSELMAEVFGPEKGVGARSAVGMGSLPGNIAVEIEAIFEIK